MDIILLFEEYKDLVYNTAVNIVQQTEDAEDVAQEVFIELHRSISKFDHRSALSTWIYRITINKSIDLLRKRKRLRGGGILSIGNYKDGEIDLEIGHFDHPGILAENKEKARLLFAAIEKLPINQRTAFILFHIEELRQKEIAEIMNTSPKAIESLIQRAKAALKKMLEIYQQKHQGK